jgi:AraC family transcriptional regulator
VYFGKLVRHRSAGPFTITESAFSGRAKLPTHSHEAAYFTFTLQGSYEERYGVQRRRCTPGTAVAHPAFESHSEEFDGEPALLIRVALTENGDEYAAQTALAEPACLKSAPIARAILELHHELPGADPSSDLIVEGLAYELMGHVLGINPSINGSRKRAVCAQMFMRSSLRRTTSLGVVASELGVSRATLYRDFKSTFNCSPGDYLRQARLSTAAALLRKTTRPICEIAAECGFYDQSHFDRNFRLAVGVSPSEYRRLG